MGKAMAAKSALLTFLSRRKTLSGRRLAIINRCHVSICVTNIFGQGRGIVDPVKNVLVLCLITVHNFVTFSHTMCMHTGGPQTLRDAGAHTCDRGVANPPPQKHALLTC